MEHRDDERCLVFAIAESARENLCTTVGFVAVDAELQRDIPGLLYDVVVDRAHLRSLVRKALRQRLGSAPDLIVRNELIFDETPIPTIEVFPRFVGRNVDVTEDLGVRRLKRLFFRRRDIAGQEAENALVPLLYDALFEPRHVWLV